MEEEIRKFNEELFDYYSNFLKENKNKYTNPYLIVPSSEYISSDIRILVEGKETNGWGGEFDNPTSKELECLYNTKINKNWDKFHSKFWGFYYSLRCISEGENVEQVEFEGKVGFCASNIALIGKPYGQSGYDLDIQAILASYQKKLLNILKPDIIICLIGCGTDTQTDKNYISLLEKTLGRLSLKSEISKELGLFDIRFEKPLNFGKKDVMILGCGHPQNKTKEWRESIKTFLIDILKKEFWVRRLERTNIC